jgi:phage terminase large subunit GpA-like protein
MATLDRIFSGLRSLITPRARLKPSEWADRYAYVPSEGNAEPGKYRTSRMPYQRDMLDDAVDPTVAESAWKIASQLGKTLCFVIIDGYFIDQDPSGILDVYPTIDSAKSYRREKLDPFIKANPKLKGKVKPPRSRYSENTTLNFKFPGGNLTLCGANSPSGLRQRSKRVVKQDEIDAYEANAEGDPMVQADKRAETFHNAVKLKSSTPTFKGTSRIDALYEKSDKQNWFCPCAHCGHWQALEWEQMRFDEKDPTTARYECENCKTHWTDSERIEAICAGEWRATAPFKGIRGRYLNGLYRIIGKKDCHETYLQEFVVEHLSAREKGELALIVWENTFRARAYAQKAECIEIQPLLDRRELYKAEIPQGALMLTAGCDVQGDRLEASVWGWGDREESWLIRHEIFTGNPTEEDVWNRLRDFLLGEFQHENGQKMRIACTMIDMGHLSTEVYRFTKPLERYAIYACRGIGHIFSTPCPALPARNNPFRAARFDIGTHSVKNQLFYRLRVDKPGPRYVHFPLNENRGCDLVYFEQFTAEQLVTKREGGQVVKRWEIPEGEDRRNETLDCAVYAFAGLFRMRPNWGALQKRMVDAVSVQEKKPEQTAPLRLPKPEPEQPTRRPAAVRPPRRGGGSGGFVGAWR